MPDEIDILSSSFKKGVSIYPVELIYILGKNHKEVLYMKKIIAMLLMLMLIAMPALAEGFSFTAQDMDGNTVTEEIFAPYDVTMVNIWATWCGYCIDEMPFFPELKDKLPENANLITICEDASYEPELTKEILDSVGANFTTIQANEEIYTEILSNVYGFPTTLFVDENGEVIGQPIIGVPSMDHEEALNAYYQAVMLRLNIVE